MARMTRQTWARRVVTLGAAAALPLTLAAGNGAASGMTADSQGATSRTAQTQLVTFKAPGCDGCRVTLHNARWGDGDDVDIWSSKGKKVKNGRVTFAVPAGLTRGLSVAVRSTWEGRTNYVTHVAFKYGGTRTGEVVTVDEATTKQRGSACWGGTDRRRTTLRLTTAKVTVEGADGSPTTGTLAFTRVTQPAMDPMAGVHDGVLGSQDVNICGKR